jgi:hypothetical protein
LKVDFPGVADECGGVRVDATRYIAAQARRQPRVIRKRKEDFDPVGLLIERDLDSGLRTVDWLGWFSRYILCANTRDTAHEGRNQREEPATALSAQTQVENLQLAMRNLQFAIPHSQARLLSRP